MQKHTFEAILKSIREAEVIAIPSNPELNQKKFEEDVKNLPTLPNLPSLSIYISNNSIHINILTIRNK